MNTARPESIALFCLTPGGVQLAKRLALMLPVTCFASEHLQEEGFVSFNGGFAPALREAFTHYPALIFIGATGIAVRVLAPLIDDKLSDPAVVVIDERGQHVISLLSGHAGGANALTRYLAGILGADPVITTATDVNEMAALDTLAIQLNARMRDFRTTVKIVNQMLVSHQRVGLWWDVELDSDVSQCDRRGFITVSDLQHLPELDALVCITLRNTLPELPLPHWKLVPQRVVAGIGCRRNTPYSLLATLLSRQLEAQQFDPLALKAIGSVSLKKDEAGLLQLAACWRVPFETFTADALREHEHRFAASPFVRQTVGVGSVSGPAAWLLSHGQLRGETLREQGVTITLGVSH
ncbi:cobalt-precorrin 5A hydrolase [Enterobacter sichuanensis]|uniref:cobalt-precorrin 5A hydrolase n=1 Tax=Enterobacter TaxID=547 RepID=UPI000BA8B544|nr:MULTISPECIES: cobalt-precorrin 5A hydrolase [Enterobacter]PAN92457.1 cobalamin biosynthesis protein CbiG [Enterobacter cloacae]MCI8903701.1 cobalt-precorrin 5A hydrolase [Enterobacter sp.]MEA5168869.1 cobalt-precorrin 5A hydrolase [Enterobacter sichuanensis]MEB5959040.1 cobalt-precorrin 5A hydrolase [Enterobacter sichuanensis]PAO05359.1 cobalamin biosynthesis protein CbiG [Enterobacter cloacae]